MPGLCASLIGRLFIRHGPTVPSPIGRKDVGAPDRMDQRFTSLFWNAFHLNRSELAWGRIALADSVGLDFPLFPGAFLPVGGLG